MRYSRTYFPSTTFLSVAVLGVNWDHLVCFSEVKFGQERSSIRFPMLPLALSANMYFGEHCEQSTPLVMLEPSGAER